MTENYDFVSTSFIHPKIYWTGYACSYYPGKGEILTEVKQNRGKSVLWMKLGQYSLRQVRTLSFEIVESNCSNVVIAHKITFFHSYWLSIYPIITSLNRGKFTKDSRKRYTRICLEQSVGYGFKYLEVYYIVMVATSSFFKLG